MCRCSPQTEARRKAIVRMLRRGLITADKVAAKYRVSVRTIYRDIDQLRRQGQPIVGEAGVGYLLRPRGAGHG